MIPEEKDVLVRYRLEQSKESLGDANSLFSLGSFCGAVNRAYYAMFYSVLAILVIDDKGTSKHSGAISLFDINYIKKGIFPKKMSEILHRVFDLRQFSDYREFAKVTKKQAEEVVKDAEQFINKVEDYIKSLI